MISVDNLTVSFGGQDLFKEISFLINPKDRIGLVGKNGAGKSTLLRTIAGLEPIQGGTIALNGEIIETGKPGTESAGRSKRGSELRTRVGMVFQSYDLFPNKTVLGNIMMAPLLVQKRDKAEVEREALELLGKVGLADRKDAWPHELSGGQRQRVAICRALILHPEVLLFDEPLSNLDAKLRDDTRSEIKRLQREMGITTLYVTHDQAEAMAVSDGPSGTSEVAKRMGRSAKYAATYRKRLLDAYVIRQTDRGEVDFAVPFLREYLRGHMQKG